MSGVETRRADGEARASEPDYIAADQGDGDPEQDRQETHGDNQGQAWAARRGP